jgi:hypothetical protein
MKTQHGNHLSPVIQQIWLPATILSVNELLYCVLHPLTVVMFVYDLLYLSIGPLLEASTVATVAATMSIAAGITPMVIAILNANCCVSMF